MLKRMMNLCFIPIEGSHWIEKVGRTITSPEGHKMETHGDASSFWVTLTVDKQVYRSRIIHSLDELNEELAQVQCE